jgi:phosphoribosylanthranilate isomerase
MKIKICGITNLRDAETAIEAGADMLGFNFYPKSLRYMSPQGCASILKLLSGQVDKITSVGVFVNSSVEEILSILKETGLQAAQLAGDEPVESLARLGSRAFKSVRYPSTDGSESKKEVTPTTRSIQEYAGLRGNEAPAFLLDSLVRGSYGGTGKVADWDRAAKLAGQYPILLAGGLTPENVQDAIAKVHPWGVDVASGVESRPGEKDEIKVWQFIRNARTAEK